jgi:hypothetical protein
MTPEQIKDELRNFTGTEHYYKHPFGILFSDGLKFLCDEAQCYWLLDLVASYQVEESVMNEPFQVFKLTVNKDHSALVEISDGNDNILQHQFIEYTDFCLDEMIIWCIDKICILPSEY